MAAIGSVASIVAILQLTSTVTKLCYDYVSAAKHAWNDIHEVIRHTRHLEDILVRLQDLDSDPDDGSFISLLRWAREPGGPLDRCFVELRAIAEVLRPCLKSSSSSATENGIRRASKAAGKAIVWPFKQKAILRSMEVIQREKETLHLALAGDTAAVVRSVKASAEAVQVAQNTQRREGVLKWLMATNPRIYHDAARAAHEPTTGEWFLGGDIFKEWKSEKRSFAWLHGIPGCGKSILCSSIIEATMTYCAKWPAHALAYFYFDFNDGKTEQAANFLSALIAQLCPEENELPSVVERLYDNHSCYSSRPNIEELARTLGKLSELHHRIFLIIDALDECAKREELLKLLAGIFEWKECRFNILVTSRRETDIEAALKDVVSRRICIQSSDVGADIRTFVRSRLSDDSKLKTWSEATKSEIEATLVERAGGMFRWAICQLECLRSCVTRAYLKTALKSLPKTLPDTYDRILMNINESHRKIALTVLRLLAFSGSLLYLEEAAEASAVRVGSFTLDPDERLRDPQEILTICSSLLTEIPITDQYGKLRNELRLAHYSVKEYLVSDGIKNGPASYFGLDEVSAHRTIAETCLTYLLSFKSAHRTSLKVFHNEFPLYDYAANFSFFHARKGTGSTALVSLSLLLLKPSENDHCFQNWLQVHRPDILPYNRFIEPNALDPWIKTPLYYASCLGLLDTAEELLKAGVDVNGDGGRGEFPLMAAVNQDRIELVELLLENRADVHIWSSNHYVSRAGAAWNSRDSAGGTHVTPLHVAAARGQERIVSLLLNKGADINAADCPDPKFKSVFGAPLTHAVRSGNLGVVRLLLERGADIKVLKGRYGYPLQQAAYRGIPQVVRLLLDHGADVDNDGDEYGNALCAVIAAGFHEKTSEMVKVLLRYHANPNANVRGYPGRALCLASKRNLRDVMCMLLDSGANIDAQGGSHGPALTATAWDFGNTEAMRLLLERGANANAIAVPGGTALGAAIAIGDEEGVELLLANCADLAIVTRNRPEMTRLLITVRCCAFSRPTLEKVAQGAEIDLRTLLQSRVYEVQATENNGEFERVLMAAAIAKNGRAMGILLEEVNDLATGGYQKALERALVEAAHAGSLAVVKLLLGNGVSPDSRHEGESALQAAWASSFEGHSAVADELLRHGAKPEWPFPWKKGTRWVEFSRWAEIALEPDGLS